MYQIYIDILMKNFAKLVFARFIDNNYSVHLGVGKIKGINNVQRQQDSSRPSRQLFLYQQKITFARVCLYTHLKCPSTVT